MKIINCLQYYFKKGYINRVKWYFIKEMLVIHVPHSYDIVQWCLSIFPMIKCINDIKVITNLVQYVILNSLAAHGGRLLPMGWTYWPKSI